jgi:3-dehydroquinate synthetase
VAVGSTPPARADRIERLLTSLGLGVDPLPYSVDAVLDTLATDKKHAGGELRWVLPTATRVEVRSDVADELVRSVATGVLSGVRAEATT